jgi:hypothetical protein
MLNNPRLQSEGFSQRHVIRNFDAFGQAAIETISLNVTFPALSATIA